MTPTPRFTDTHFSHRESFTGSHFNFNVHQYSLENISAESFPFLPEIFFVKDCIEEKNNSFCGRGKIIFHGK